MENNKHTLIYLKSDKAELRVSIIGHQYPDASPATLDAEWLLFRVEAHAPEGRWTRDDPAELAPRILDLPDWFLHHAEGKPNVPEVYLFTDQTLILELAYLGSEKHRLRVKIQDELLDRCVIDADELNLDFEVTKEELFELATQSRRTIAAYPPRRPATGSTGSISTRLPRLTCRRS